MERRIAKYNLKCGGRTWVRIRIKNLTLLLDLDTDWGKRLKPDPHPEN
jgi:hypothetical protein